MRGGTGISLLSTSIPNDFNPPSPCGEGRSVDTVTGGFNVFQSTLPMRGGTHNFGLLFSTFIISIHPPHAGRDHCGVLQWNRLRNFNPPSPCGEGRGISDLGSGAEGFQSTLPMRGGTGREPSPNFLFPISIHPPHAGRDSTSSQNIFGNLCTYHKTSHLHRNIQRSIQSFSPYYGVFCSFLLCEPTGESLFASPSHH